MIAGESIECLGVEPSDREVVGVGKVDDDDIVELLILFEELPGIVIDDGDLFALISVIVE